MNQNRFSKTKICSRTLSLLKHNEKLVPFFFDFDDSSPSYEKNIQVDIDKIQLLYIAFLLG